MSSAFFKAMKPSANLAAVIGDKEVSRTEAVKLMWEYIKSNNLQDPANKRMIRSDSKLKPMFDGKNEVSMFDMTKYLNANLGQ